MEWGGNNYSEKIQTLGVYLKSFPGSGKSMHYGDIDI